MGREGSLSSSSGGGGFHPFGGRVSRQFSDQKLPSLDEPYLSCTSPLPAFSHTLQWVANKGSGNRLRYTMSVRLVPDHVGTGMLSGSSSDERGCRDFAR